MNNLHGDRVVFTSNWMIVAKLDFHNHVPSESERAHVMNDIIGRYDGPKEWEPIIMAAYWMVWREPRLSATIRDHGHYKVLYSTPWKLRSFIKLGDIPMSFRYRSAPGLTEYGTPYSFRFKAIPIKREGFPMHEIMEREYSFQAKSQQPDTLALGITYTAVLDDNQRLVDVIF